MSRKKCIRGAWPARIFSARGAFDERFDVVVDEFEARGMLRRAVARGDRLRGLRSFANSL
jgi:hypothetical protein